MYGKASLQCLDRVYSVSLPLLTCTSRLKESDENERAGRRQREGLMSRARTVTSLLSTSTSLPRNGSRSMSTRRTLRSYRLAQAALADPTSVVPGFETSRVTFTSRYHLA
jgi:hypothetical protein